MRRPLALALLLAAAGCYDFGSLATLYDHDAGTDAANQPPGWARQPVDSTVVLYGVWGSSSGVYAVGGSGEILHAADGRSWQRDATTNDYSLYTVWGNDLGEVLTAGDLGTLLHHPVGGAWTLQNSGTAVTLYGISGLSAAVGAVVVGEGGAIIVGTRATGWTSLSGPTPNVLYAVWGAGNSEFFAVGGYGTILYRATGFNSPIVVQQSPTQSALRGVWGSSRTDVYAVGDSGTILHSGDEGSTWDVLNGHTNADLAAVWGSGPDDVYVVGLETILHSVDRGQTWDAQTEPAMGLQLQAVWGDGPHNVYAVGAELGVRQAAILHYQ
jgi:photosystem II stability/assembly factor-like uncharacterized protein